MREAVQICLVRQHRFGFVTRMCRLVLFGILGYSFVGQGLRPNNLCVASLTDFLPASISACAGHLLVSSQLAGQSKDIHSMARQLGR